MFIALTDDINMDVITDLFLTHLEALHNSIRNRSSAEIFDLIKTIGIVQTLNDASSAEGRNEPYPGLLQRLFRVIGSPAALRGAIERRLTNLNRIIRSRIRRTLFPMRARLYGFGWKQLIPGDEIKLHVGCGRDRWDDYINIDAASPEADWNAELDAIRMPEASVARIEGHHVIEHLSLQQARAFLQCAYRMLQPGGKIVLEYPDIGKITDMLTRAEFEPDFLTDHPLGLRGIFGEPKPGMNNYDFHRWGYSATNMQQVLSEAGFRHMRFSEGLRHGFPLRDTRVEALKPPPVNSELINS